MMGANFNERKVVNGIPEWVFNPDSKREPLFFRPGSLEELLKNLDEVQSIIDLS